MTLTLDEVRKTRFHMARRAGYEVTDVDNFVDKVEATMMHLTEENQTLKQQLSTISRAEPGSDVAAENARLRKELEEARAASARPGTAVPAGGDAALAAELERLRAENQRLRAEAEQDRASRPGAPAAATGSREELVVTTAEQASPAVIRLVQLATSQAEQVVSEADAEAKRKLADATKQADEIQVDARSKAERIESEARASAEKLTTDARTEAENLNKETAARRSEMFTSLESERDELQTRIQQLRAFEASFRENLTAHLRGQIESLEKGVFEPEAKPGLVDAPAPKAEPTSATPRLDALLGDAK